MLDSEFISFLGVSIGHILILALVCVFWIMSDCCVHGEWQTLGELKEEEVLLLKERRSLKDVCFFCKNMKIVVNYCWIRSPSCLSFFLL